MGIWLRYSATPNIPTLCTQCTQAKKWRLPFLLQSLPAHCLCSYFDQYKNLFLNLSAQLYSAELEVQMLA